jgi:hypothetical protein
MSMISELSRARLAYFTKVDEAAAPEQTTAREPFFGADGLTFGDVLDAINPLNHLPVVSQLTSSADQPGPSLASRLVGGALLGGPVGFAVTLAGMVVKDATGQTPLQLAAAAFSDEPASLQTAAQEPVLPEAQTASATQTLDPQMQALVASLDAQTQAALGLQDEEAAEPQTAKQTHSANPVLELYGASPASAHASYRSAQMRPYLTDVTVSQAL